MFDDLQLPIEFTAAGDTPEEQKTNLKIVKPSPGFEPASELAIEIILKDANVTVMDFNAQKVVTRFQIDGLWHTGAPMDREIGDYTLATLKQLAGLDYRERRQRQEGTFSTLYKKQKQKFKIVSQGIQSGERVAIYLDYKRPPLDKALDLGMRERMLDQLRPILNDQNTGTILISGVPGEGYTTAWRGVLDACDRLTRDYFVIEEKGKLEPEVINIYPVEFDPSKGETAMTPIPQLLLKEPDVLAFTDLTSGELINDILDISVNKKIPIFTRIPGKHCVDALLRVLLLKPNVKKFAESLTCVLSMRLIRLLCPKCRIPYQPHPTLLQKLGLPVGRIAELYKPMAYQPGMVDENNIEIEPCSGCGGIGYRGRTGIFEMLKINDDLRRAIVKTPQANKVSALAKHQGHISLQMEGVVMVAAGRTSIEELQRVLKS
jgi:type II secretory ATPase GspE/PulE/Tfp pilus assembly ATPase PilB-like protein